MINYILSIDPSAKNTGFTLWKKEIEYSNSKNNTITLQREIWKPIWVSNYRFDRYDDKEFLNNIKWHIRDILGGVIDKPNWLDNLTLYIERGFQGNRGSETLDHLRGNIFGLFNKYLSNDKLISPKEWQNWYKNNLMKQLGFIRENEKYSNWDKEISLELAKFLINLNNWNININNDNDIADSLLIGWYVINVKLVE